MKIKLTKNGVLVSIANQEVVYDDPKELDALINQLQEAKLCLVENKARASAEENQLWE